MTTILVILAMVVVVGIAAMFYEMRKHFKRMQEGGGSENQVLMEWLKDMREAQQQQGSQIEQQMRKQTTEINDRLNRAAVELGKVQEHTAVMKELQQTLLSPKLRGNVGENLMRDILAQCLPKANFKLQYGFKSGEKVDAVIVTKSGLIPVDSKFPLEKYLAAQKAKDADKPALVKEFHKQVKKHIDDIAKKYILPAEDTVDFAFMYVPGEPVFYELYNTTELVDYGSARKVILVSPNSFFYLLKIVLVGLEGEQAEERAKLVLRELQAIQNDAGKLGVDLGILNRHVTNAKNVMESVNTSYTRLGTKIEQAGRLSDEPTKAKKLSTEKAIKALEATDPEPAETVKS